MQEYFGKMVTVQLNRPIYLCDYVAHTKVHGQEAMLCEPATMFVDGQKQPVAPNFMVGLVVAAGDAHIKLRVITPANHYVSMRFHERDIVCISQLEEFEPELPAMTYRTRKPPSKVIV